MTIPSRLIRRFSEILGLLDRGQFEAKCSEAVAEAIESLKGQPGEKGKATVTVSLEIAFDQGLVNIKPSLKSKLPEARTFASTVLWATEDGALSAQHPSQVDLEDHIRKVTTPTPQLA